MNAPSALRQPNGWSSALRALLRWSRGRDLRWLLGMLFVVASAWAFVEIADEVVEGSTHAWDERAITALRTPGDLADPLGPPWAEEAVRDLSALGGMTVVALVTLTVAGLLVMRRMWGALWLVLVSTLGAVAASLALKGLFDRPRPDLVAHGAEVATASFPSAHSMVSAAVYLTLGALLARLTSRQRVKLYFVGVALVLTALVGFSRVYLGVHYPSDVLAGWAAGLAWAVMCWIVARWLQRRGNVEPPEDPTGVA